MSELISKLPLVRGEYRSNADLKNWFNVAAKAEVLFRPEDIEDLQSFLQNLPKEIPVTILGAASNVIIRNGGIKGVTIRFGKNFAKISHESNIIKSGVGALCGNVALYSRDAALTNFEFLTGIPGSIGGAIAMNAGCYGSDMSKIVFKVKALDYSGNLHELKNSDFQFYYRGNKISEQFIFVEALLEGEKSNIDDVAKKIAEFNRSREESQPIRAKTGGSTFKNPNSNLTSKKAWELIDESGCRGLQENDAQISIKHCNFMINNANASALDLINLGSKIQKAVKDKTGIELQWEIKILGQD
ncbi:MAG: UDP-N-acetylmuramate dehydrogenase [Pelagibacterales bacterium]|nr:UDP-N-acetylmuramate dehydrogenase [Pelagibacterales bacterium]